MSRSVLATDSETFLITPGNLTPPSVCWSSDIGDGAPQLQDRVTGLRLFLDRMGDPDVLHVLHNAPYDLAVAAADAARVFGEDVLPGIFQALDQCRITDTLTRQKIMDLADGKLGQRSYSLASLTQTHLGVAVDKKDGTRTSYGELADKPLEQWPARAVEYAKTDALVTRAVFATQQMSHGGAKSMGDLATAPGVVTEFEQVRADFALHLMSAWGIRTDPDAVRVLERRQDDLILQVVSELGGTGWLKGGASKSTKAIQAAVLADWKGRGAASAMPTTDSGAPSIAAESLRACADPKLRRLADHVEASWVKSNPVPALWKGAEAPINARYDVLKETGRTGCSKPNMQNWKRGGGIRECFIPRPGYVFVSVDYETLELRTLAQHLFELFGPGEMWRALQEDRDLHVDMAACMLGISYEDAFRQFKTGTPEQRKAIKEKRQFAKAANFGLPGGMGAEGLVLYAAGMGVVMDLGQAQVVKDYWLRRWPEMARYFHFVKQHLGADGTGAFTHPISGLRVGRASFTAMANAFFQARAAHGAKRALYEATFRCYVNRTSPLYGSRPVAFLHDEILAEVPEEVAHEAAWELAAVMREQMAGVCPNVPIKAKPALMRRWYKDAEDVVDGNGRLIPWEPKQ